MTSAGTALDLVHEQALTSPSPHPHPVKRGATPSGKIVAGTSGTQGRQRNDPGTKGVDLRLRCDHHVKPASPHLMACAAATSMRARAARASPLSCPGSRDRGCLEGAGRAGRAAQADVDRGERRIEILGEGDVASVVRGD